MTRIPMSEALIADLRQQAAQRNAYQARRDAVMNRLLDQAGAWGLRDLPDEQAEKIRAQATDEASRG